MIHTTYTCDGCRHEVEAKPGDTPDELRDWLVLQPRRVRPRPNEIGLPEVHLCGDCLRQDENPLRVVLPA